MLISLRNKKTFLISKFYSEVGKQINKTVLPNMCCEEALQIKLKHYCIEKGCHTQDYLKPIRILEGHQKGKQAGTASQQSKVSENSFSKTDQIPANVASCAASIYICCAESSQGRFLATVIMSCLGCMKLSRSNSALTPPCNFHSLFYEVLP